MFSSLAMLSSSAITNSSFTSSAATKVLTEIQNQNFEEEIPLTSKDEVEKKLASILTQVQQNQIKRLNLTSASFGRCYELANTLSEHQSWISSLAALKSGGDIASGSGYLENSIKLWDLDSSSCLATLRGHTDAVCTLAVFSNGQLASGSWDKTIKLWNLVSYSCFSTLQGHTSFVNALIVLPNSQLASGSADHAIKFWDVAAHSCLATLQGHTDTVCTLTVLPNGQLASGSYDKTIKLWKSKTLSVQHLQPILKALRNNTSVTDLDLSGNQDILDDLIDPLISIFTPDTSSGLKPNTSLKIIDLRRTGVSQKGTKKLEKAIQHQGLSINVLADCPIEWMMIYFLIIFCRANRNSPFADSGLDLCKHGQLGSFLGISSGFFARPRKNSSYKYVILSPT